MVHISRFANLQPHYLNDYYMLKEIQETGKKDTRSGFGDGIIEVARKNPNVVALTADLAGSLKLNQFIKEYPERYIQCGIGEANMIGMAAA
jgi:transketolase